MMKNSNLMTRATLTLLVMMLTATTAWAWDGSGTLYDPYLIKTTDDLNLLAHRVNGTHGETLQTDGYGGKYFKLANDIAYSYTYPWNVASTEDNFEPIGNYDFRFHGHFEGAGHTISGIRISRSGHNNNSANFCLGIFGYTGSGAYIHGLTLADARITGDFYLGGIVGYFEGGQVIDCHVADDVAVCAGQKNASYHGGIVGYNYSGMVRDCTSAVTLTDTDAANGGYHYIGGIAGANDGNLNDNLVIGATIPAADENTYGAICGYYNRPKFDHLHNNYYTACTVAGTVNAIGVGYSNYDENSDTSTIADVTMNNGAVPGYLITLGEGISIASGVTTFTIPAHGETEAVRHYVAAHGAQVTIVEGESYYLLSVTYNDGSGDHAVSPNADGKYIFTMPAANVTVSAAFTAIPWAGEGTEGNPYLIEYASQLNLLAHRVNGTHGETRQTDGYSGKYFKLANDIDYKANTQWNDANSTENNFETIGGYFDDNYRTFMGDFDGDGHTISGIRIYKGGSGNANSFQGIFGYTGNGANIHDLTLADARITSFWYTGGIAGINSYGCTLSGCHVADDVAVCAVKYNTNYHGGIVGSNHGTISDCTSAATLTLTDAANSQYFGGIVGNNSDGILRNNLAIGATVPAAKDNTHGAISGVNGGTLERNYYTACTVDGTVNATGVGSNKADVTTNDGAVPGYFITLAEDLSIASGATTITIPAHGETAAVRHHVAAHGAQVILVCDLVCDEGYYQISITYNDGSGDHAVSPDDDGKYTITMPAANVTVSAALIAIPWAGEGTEGNPYIIEYASQLNLLAYRVNGTHGETRQTDGYRNKYFKLGADITYKYTTQWNDTNSTENNFESIGDYFHSFCADFNGAGHTISGIRIYKDGESLQGLFSTTDEGIIHDLTLADARITGNDYTGGIVGINFGTISGCHVADDVAICAVREESDYFGGVVGSNNYGTISGCTSAVTLTLTDAATNSAFGGIAGENCGGTLRDNFVIGATIPAVEDNTYGAITGNNLKGTLERNYYTACKVASENVTPSGVGCGNPVADVTTNDGAVPAGFTQDGNTYTISTASGWYVFCHLLAENAKGYFTGKTVVLANDITVTRMAGSSNHDFTGTFDGGNHTLTFNHAASDNYCAPFRYVQGNAENDHAVIRRLNVVSNITAADHRHPAGLIALQSGYVDVTDCNVEANIICTKGTTNPSNLYPAALVSQSNNTGSLTVSGCTTSGTIATDGMYAAGIIGIVQKKATIRNSLSSVTIQSSTNGDGTHGGLIATLPSSSSATIEGCVFNGELLGSTTIKTGGFIGWGNSTVTITNSLFAPAEVTISTNGSATFVRNGSAGTNCYYTRTLGTAQGKQPRTVTAGDDVSVETIALTGTATAYSVSGITAYSGGGLSCGGTLYYGSGDSVSLSLSHDSSIDDLFLGYEAKDSQQNTVTLTAAGDNYKLTMPNSDVTITVTRKLKGDVNRDGNVDISDVVALVNIILNSSSDYQAEADLNNDGDIDISDVVALVNIILGQ